VPFQFRCVSMFKCLIHWMLFFILSAVIVIQVYILVTCSDAMDTDCTKKANIWLFCVWYFCGMAVLGLISALAMLVSAWLNLIQPVVATAFAVWGTQLWSCMDEECYNSYPPHRSFPEPPHNG
jgi:hypothetical protein